MCQLNGGNIPERTALGGVPPCAPRPNLPAPGGCQVSSSAAAESQAFERQTIRAFDAKALEELKAKGMQVTTLPEAEVAKLREKTKPVWTKFTKEFGEAEAAEMMAALAKARGTN